MVLLTVIPRQVLQKPVSQQVCMTSKWCPTIDRAHRNVLLEVRQRLKSRWIRERRARRIQGSRDEKILRL